MELKGWKEYTKEEKEKLLLHWWHYYGKMLIRPEEYEKYIELVNTRTDEIFNCALFSYARGFSSQVLLMAIRQGTVDELLSSLPETETKDELYNKAVDALGYEFLDIVVGSYNNPEPDVPMSPEEIVSQLL